MIPFLISFLLTGLITPAVIRLAWRLGWVARPRENRWHSRPTAVMGGIAIFLGTVAAWFAAGELPAVAPLAVLGTAMFLMGVVDDRLLELRPGQKLVPQFAAGVMLYLLGTRVPGCPLWLALPLTLLWVGLITNAINLLDNMDGLAAGVSCIAALALAVCSLHAGDAQTASALLALAGSCAGFLLYNFHPARVFMGDCGSMFIGFSLATLALRAGAPSGGEPGIGPYAATSPALSLLVPVAALAVPIFDTTLVAAARALNGRPVFPGARDHASHRLVFLGLSDPQSVLVLYALTLLSGVLALAAPRLPLVVFVLVAALFGAGMLALGLYLGRLKLYPERTLTSTPECASHPRLRDQATRLAHVAPFHSHFCHPGEEPMKVSNRIHQLAQGGILTLLLATVLIVPLLYSPNAAAWRTVKPVVFEIMALALVGLALMQATLPGSGKRLLAFLRTGPNLPILLLVLYGAFSWSRSSAPAFSGAEWIRLACGAGLYFVVATMLRRREQVQTLVDALIAVAILTSLFGFATYGQSDGSMSSSFGNSQLLAGFLLILLPLLFVLWFSDMDVTRKVAAQVAALLAVTALVLAQTRSAWIAAVVALGALGVLALRYGARGGLARMRQQVVLPVALGLGALGVFFLVSQTPPLVAARAATLAAPAHDGSLTWRFQMWATAVGVFRQNPVFGTGIGTFPAEYARLNPAAVPCNLPSLESPTLSREVHNEYLQIAAETGIVGLGLYLWILGAFFCSGLGALRTGEAGLRKLVLMGCLAALAGQMVDALSNPAWRFAEVSFMFWLLMGLGMATAAALRRASVEEPAPVGAPAYRGLGRLGWQGLAGCFSMLSMGMAWAAGFGSDGCPLASYASQTTYEVVPSSVTLYAGSPHCQTFTIYATIQGEKRNVTSCMKSFVESAPGACLTNQVQGNGTGPFCAPDSKACGQHKCGGSSYTIIFGPKNGGRPDAVATGAKATVTVSCSNNP